MYIFSVPLSSPAKKVQTPPPVRQSPFQVMSFLFHGLEDSRLKLATVDKVLQAPGSRVEATCPPSTSQSTANNLFVPWHPNALLSRS